jgi:hypothetical protein
MFFLSKQKWNEKEPQTKEKARKNRIKRAQTILHSGKKLNDDDDLENLT